MRPSGGPQTDAPVETSAPLSPENSSGLDGKAGGAGSLPLPVLGPVLSAATGEDNAAAKEEEEEAECFYYSFCPDDSHRLIALDSYDVHAIREELGPGEEKGDAEGQEEGGGNKNDNGDRMGARKAGMQVLSKHNPNKDMNDASGMDGLNQRYSRRFEQTTTGLSGWFAAA